MEIFEKKTIPLMKDTLFVQMKRTVTQGLMCAPLTAAQDSIDT